jgi:flotillin
MDLDPATLAIVLSSALAIVVLLFAVTFVVSRFLYICPPSEILIFSGRRQRMTDGSHVGFKVLHGGRGFRVPLLETVSKMDVRLFGVEVGVQNAFSRGGIPLTVHAIANVKLNTDPRHVTQAVERFLGMPQTQMQIVAKQTLEGVLREVLSQLTPEEVNEDRLKFAETLMKNAKDDFDKLGLELDVLKVQHVADEQKYLANLGRAQIASMIRDAQNAENEAEQVVSQAQAVARQRAETAQNQAEAIILQKKNQFRAEIAKLEGEAKSIENEALVAAETARSTAEQELQRLRAELAKIFLQVETVLPAEAEAKARGARARGEAAPTVENGRATAEALGIVASEWASAGAHGREVFLLQQLDAILAAAVDRVSRMEIGALEIVDGGDSESVGAALGSFPRGVSRVLEDTCNAMGVDIRALLAPAGADVAAALVEPETLRGGGR